MQRLWKPLFFIAMALLVPVLPFVMLGESFETNLDGWFRQQESYRWQFLFVVVLLAVDILLPAPSSAISTYAGGILGILPATVSSFLGMTLGCLLGYGLARFVGPPFVKWFTKEDDRQQLFGLIESYGAVVIAVTRPLPILAEATIVLVGALKMPLAKLLPPLLITNLLIAACYSVFGAVSAEFDALPVAIVLSVLVPILMAIATRKHLAKRDDRAAVPERPGD